MICNRWNEGVVLVTKVGGSGRSIADHPGGVEGWNRWNPERSSDRRCPGSVTSHDRRFAALKDENRHGHISIKLRG